MEARGNSGLPAPRFDTGAVAHLGLRRTAIALAVMLGGIAPGAYAQTDLSFPSSR